MVRCLLVTPDMQFTEYDIPQKETATVMGGRITFVGAIPELNAYLCALCQSEHLKEWKHLPFMEENVRGDVFVIASDEEGGEIDLDINKAKQYFELAN